MESTGKEAAIIEKIRVVISWKKTNERALFIHQCTIFKLYTNSSSWQSHSLF